MDKPDIDLDMADMNELNMLKKWLFNENMRLVAKEKELDDERELIHVQQGLLKSQQRKNTLYKSQLDGQKALFEQKWSILENETRRLAVEREQFERTKAVYRDEAYREARKEIQVVDNGKIFFRGVKDGEMLRKRYRELMKIYHPDNFGGDSETLLSITKEYEKLKNVYFS